MHAIVDVAVHSTPNGIMLFITPEEPRILPGISYCRCFRKYLFLNGFLNFQGNKSQETTKPSQTPEAIPQSTQEIKPPQPLKSPPKKVSTKFTDVLAFSGPAPERINGRLAMVGFVSAIGVELANGDGLMAQLANGGLSWFLYATVLLSAASLVPLFRGEDPQSKTDGLMTSDAELWNGRVAMLGLVALAFTEYVKGGALV